MSRRKRNRKPLNLDYGPPGSSTEGRMMKSQLDSISREAQRLSSMLEDGDDLPQWTLNKIATALDRLTSAENYLISKIERATVRRNPSPIPNIVIAQQLYRRTNNPDADDLMEVIEGQGYATKRQISRMKRLAT